MKFFDKILGKFVFNYRGALVLLIFIWFGLCVYFATCIPRKSQSKNLLSDKLPVQKAKNILDSKIGQKDDIFSLYFVFGTKVGLYNWNHQNKGSYWKRTYAGDVAFDAYFDLSPKDNQQQILDLCLQLNQSQYISKEVDCPMFEIKKIADKKHLEFPLEPEVFNQTMIEYAKK